MKLSTETPGQLTLKGAPATEPAAKEQSWRCWLLRNHWSISQQNQYSKKCQECPGQGFNAEKNKTRKTTHLENCTSIDPKHFQATVFDVTLVFVLYPTHSAVGCSTQSLISPLIAEHQCPQVHSWRSFVSLMCQVDFFQR